jgi:hypothetical protein
MPSSLVVKPSKAEAAVASASPMDSQQIGHLPPSALAAAARYELALGAAQAGVRVFA